ncbi:rhomboid family intramembrane serine protease [Labrys monachus]|uniref:Membrane associated rhomboid family serine protease n=1 Tax=Labrys monachus TaxID=217067 RepID=A0ABU0FHI0_9HYPH|nr:rhomboid family intramembrane serine protease [Labrys monachus]MDQ0394063.1 membrane associated rhomboid family serine protease [Labrys monachus]
MPAPSRNHAAPPPAFNVPPVVLVLTGLLVAVHVLRNVLPEMWAGRIVPYLAFMPVRYLTDSEQFGQWAGGHFADVWTFVTCFFLQADAGTLIINGAALLVLGAAVAWRLGTKRFLVFTTLCIVAGSVTCLVAYWGQPVVIVGAGGGISGLFAAAIHFIFKGGSPMAGFQVAGGAAFRRPAWPLRDALADQNVRVWLAIFAFINLWYVASYYILASAGETTGWPANIGGFAAGLVLFRYFDPKPRLRRVV